MKNVWPFSTGTQLRDFSISPLAAAPAEFDRRHRAREPQHEPGARPGVDDVPHLGLARAVFAGHGVGVVGVHLHGEILRSEQQLREDGKVELRLLFFVLPDVARRAPPQAGRPIGAAHQTAAEMLDQFPQGLPRKRAVGNGVLLEAEPGLADLLRLRGENRAQIARAPDLGPQRGGQLQWIQGCQWIQRRQEVFSTMNLRIRSRPRSSSSIDAA